LALVKPVCHAAIREAELSLTTIDSQSVKLEQKGGTKLELMATKR
jgi:hypothetical protein